VVTIYSVEEAEGTHFLTMELVERTLTELIAPGGLALPMLLKVAIPLADAISAAHAQGIIHRDLKPSNVMVGPTGRVRLAAFNCRGKFEFAMIADPKVPVACYAL
jgi:serine/threonine protein kinase